MAYAFEDYDAFLSSFGGSAQPIQHNASLSTNDETDVFSDLYPELQPQLALDGELSPYSNESSPSHPNQGQPDLFANFGFSNDSSFGNVVKVDHESSQSSASSSPHDSGINAKVRLGNAVPHGSSIMKRAAKKEKSSHNMIEKKYRTNINDKIVALRDSVPALRVLVESGDEDQDDLEGLQPAKKLNKATILSKATEYIKHLEAKNDSLKAENDELRSSFYGVSNMTPVSSVSSSRSNTSAPLSFGNKVLLGGMACMVGTGLSDDFGSMDTKSLFAMPVFGNGSMGYHALSKPMVVLLKSLLVLGVLLRLVLPMLSSVKKEKAEQIEIVSDDIRDLKTRSVASTFKSSSDSNNEYVKNAIFRSVMLKARYSVSGSLTRSLVNVYVSHLWTYLKQIKLDTTAPDYEALNTVLTMENEETIDCDAYINRLATYGASSANSLSTTAVLFNLINESKSHTLLKTFMTQTLATTETIPQIAKAFVSEIDERNIELLTLLDPTEDHLSSFKALLEASSLHSLHSDDTLVLISAVVQNLIYEKKDYAAACRWFLKIDTDRHTDFTLMGFTALYMAVLSMLTHDCHELNDESVIAKVEGISGVLRIWLGKSNGSVLHHKKRSQLIDYFVNVSLRINGLKGGN